MNQAKATLEFYLMHTGSQHYGNIIEIILLALY